MGILELLLAMLAVYRLSTDIAWMDGPLNCWSKLRGAVAAAYGPGHWLTEGIGCPVCWSFWIAIPFAIVVGPLDDRLLLYWLGIAGAVALAVRMTTDD